ncbi:AbiH family protein [Streptococcus sp. NLN64]|uniref:AbiH family protein n=1 Tax=Streptococcus sp. NLN64 TaxID=2822799 RepID=UPI0018C8FC68|nr:AbiH family protein [Streptococcus sp. NLN64]MBG9367011.1 hypothetical protein [Streptococcus sp. NLN64]
MKKKLFIIGNGFDLAHGVKSDYLYFKKYVYEKAFGTSKELTNLTGKVDIADFLNEKDWEDLRVISDFDISSLPEEYEPDNQEWNQMCYQLLSQTMSDTRTWSDFEEDIVGLANPEVDFELVLDREGDVDGFKSESNIEGLGNSLLPLVAAINSLFVEWIEQTYQEWNECMGSCVEKIKKKAIVSNQDSYYLTFNYTTILEDLYDIQQENIYHIHGEIGDEIIFGHKGNDTEYDNPLDISYYTDELVLQLKKPVKEILDRSRTNDFFEKITEIEEIYFIGVGAIKTDIDDDYPGVDDPYFEKIFELMQNVDIYVDCYDEKQRSMIIKKLKKWGAEKADQLQFVDTSGDIVIDSKI